MISDKILDYITENSYRFSAKTALVGAKMMARDILERYLEAKEDLRKAERQLKKMEEENVTFMFADPIVSHIRKIADTRYQALICIGECLMDALDAWQEDGATLKDLFNFCNRTDYERVKDTITETRFSEIVMLHNLDYKHKGDWLELEKDAPLTHALWEVVRNAMLRKEEGRAGAHEAFEKVFPGLSEEE